MTYQGRTDLETITKPTMKLLVSIAADSFDNGELYTYIDGLLVLEALLDNIPEDHPDRKTMETLLSEWTDWFWYIKDENHSTYPNEWTARTFGYEEFLEWAKTHPRPEVDNVPESDPLSLEETRKIVTGIILEGVAEGSVAHSFLTDALKQQDWQAIYDEARKKEGRDEG